MKTQESSLTSCLVQLVHALALKVRVLAFQVVCDFCETHLEANKAAFADPRFQLVVDDARAQLEKWPGTFDVIVGDLADPVYGGPCYQASDRGRHH